MFKLLKTLFKLAIFLGVLGIVFTALMLGAKIWGFYSIPPSKDQAGSTLIVTRTEDEPMFNASDRPLRPPPDEVSPEVPGMFRSGPIKRRPVKERVLFKFPYVGWIHDKGKDTTLSY